MTKEDIKKAAEEYAKEACRPLWRTGNEQVCMADFMEGAEWYKNQSSWISVDERLPERTCIGCSSWNKPDKYLHHEAYSS